MSIDFTRISINWTRICWAQTHVYSSIANFYFLQKKWIILVLFLLSWSLLILVHDTYINTIDSREHRPCSCRAWSWTTRTDSTGADRPRDHWISEQRDRSNQYLLIKKKSFCSLFFCYNRHISICYLICAKKYFFFKTWV